MPAKTTTYPSREANYLFNHTNELLGHLKRVRNQMTVDVLNTGLLNKGKARLIYDLRSISEAITSLETAERSLREAHVSLAMIKEGENAD